jgi:photosystem II stability/assembly factor-like uncharacterized protein
VVWIAGADPSCPAYCIAVYRSVDGGRTWTGTSQRFTSGQALDAADAQTAWFSTEDGLWRTRDGGESWQLINVESGPWEFIDHAHGFAPSCETACDREFLITADGGVTSERRPLPNFPYPEFFLSPQIGWATGEIRDEVGGCPYCWAVFRTTDGGRTWREMWRSATDVIGGVVFIDPLRGWGMQSRVERYARNRVVFTADGGRTWTTELPDTGDQLQVRDGVVWSVAGAQPGLVSSRTTIWRRDYASNAILAPGTGAGPSGPRVHTMSMATAVAAGAALVLVLLGLRMRRAN